MNAAEGWRRLVEGAAGEARAPVSHAQQAAACEVLGDVVIRDAFVRHGEEDGQVGPVLAGHC